MFTLDKSRKSVVRESIRFNSEGLHLVESNGRGIFILQDGSSNVYWMSVPSPARLGVVLYPMKAIDQLPE